MIMGLKGARHRIGSASFPTGVKDVLASFVHKPRHDFRDIYGELSGSCRGYLLDVPSGEVGGGCRGGCIITSYFQGYSLLITTSHKLGSSIFACDSEM
jgi:hypothetical protein